MRIYLASPFFTPDQVATVEKIEGMFATFPNLDVYSPRKDGVLMNMTPEEKRSSKRRVFIKNCVEIDRSDMIFAVIDGRDTGVIWEIGYGYKGGIDVVTYTDYSYGVNVMIQECVQAHVKGLDRARSFWRRVSEGMGDEAFVGFKDFDEDKVF